jgi:hypothetical protein
MTSNTDVLLTKAAEHAQAIESMYATLVEEATITDDLMYLAKVTIETQISALDWTTNAVAVEYG